MLNLRQARTRTERLLVQRDKRRKRKGKVKGKGKEKGKGKDKDKSVTEVTQGGFPEFEQQPDRGQFHLGLDLRSDMSSQLGRNP